MRTLDTVREILAERPGLRWTVEGQTLYVEPPREHGSSVCFTDCGEEYILGLDGSHEHGQDMEEALGCFKYGLGARCRQRVTLRGKSDYPRTLEHRAEHGWDEVSRADLILAPFRRKKRVEYRRNHPPPACS